MEKYLIHLNRNMQVSTIINEIDGRATIYNHEKLKGLLNTISAKMIMNQNTFFQKIIGSFIALFEINQDHVQQGNKVLQFQKCNPILNIAWRSGGKGKHFFEATKTIFVCNYIASDS